MLFRLKIINDENINKYLSIIRKYKTESISELKSKILNSQYVFEIDSTFYDNSLSLKFITDIESIGGKLSFFIYENGNEIMANKNDLLIAIQNKVNQDKAFKDKILNHWDDFESEMLSGINDEVDND